MISFENANDINPNPDLKWEENAEFNLGLDFGILGDKLSGSIEYYRKTTRDLIYRYELYGPTGQRLMNAQVDGTHVSLESISAGIYMLKIYDHRGDLSFVGKVIRQ